VGEEQDREEGGVAKGVTGQHDGGTPFRAGSIRDRARVCRGV
jgi:hypothetical protein